MRAERLRCTAHPGKRVEARLRRGDSRRGDTPGINCWYQQTEYNVRKNKVEESQTDDVEINKNAVVMVTVVTKSTSTRLNS